MIFGLAPCETKGTVKGLKVETFMICQQRYYSLCVEEFMALCFVFPSSYMHTIHLLKECVQTDCTEYTNKQLHSTNTGFDLTLKYA